MVPINQIPDPMYLSLNNYAGSYLKGVGMAAYKYRKQMNGSNHQIIDSRKADMFQSRITENKDEESSRAKTHNIQPTSTTKDEVTLDNKNMIIMGNKMKQSHKPKPCN